MTDINQIMTTHFMLVNVRSSKPPQTRKLRNASDELAASKGADRSSVHAIKDLWAGCVEMEGVASAINGASGVHRRFTAPYMYEGPRLIRNTVLMEKYIPLMNEAVGMIETAADALLAVYDQRVQEQLAKLGGFADVNDYPTLDEINNWNWFSYTFIPVPSFNDWNRVEGVSISQYLVDQTKDATEQAARLAIQDAAKRSVEPLQRLVYATGHSTGERTRPVGQTIIANIEHAVENLRQFNVYADPVVDGIVRDLQALCAYSPDQIKKSETVKENIHGEAKAILARMTAWQGAA